MRTFKRFIKLLASALIDLFPAKKELLPALITEIRNFSRSKMRLIRFSFAQIGIQVFKHLVA
jgi:hypothetical protein